MTQKIVVRFHQETKSALESFASEKGWKTPYLVSKVLEETLPTLNSNTYRVLKDEYRNLKKGYREQTATKQMSIYLSDYALETLYEIANNHRDRTVLPATVVRDIVIKWIESQQ